MTFTACGNDETFGEPETTPAGNQVTMTFTANAPAPAAGTRTSLVKGTQVYWTLDDVIGVYSCIPNTEYGTFETEEPTCRQPPPPPPLPERLRREPCNT